MAPHRENSGNWNILSPIRKTGAEKCGRTDTLPLLVINPIGLKRLRYVSALVNDIFNHIF